MKRIHRSCVAVLLLLAMLLSCVPAIAAGGSRGFTTQQKAEALKSLGIFQGTNKGFELESTLTREQAVTLIGRCPARKRRPEKKARSIRSRTSWHGQAPMWATATRTVS